MKLTPRLAALTAGAGLTLAAVAGLPSAAFADAPPVTTTPEVGFTLPMVPPGLDHTTVTVDLATVPQPSKTWIELRCDGYDPYDLTLATPSAPGLTTWEFTAFPELGGKTCRLHGGSYLSSQSVEFSPGTTVRYVGGVPVTHADGLVIVRSRLGGLL